MYTIRRRSTAVFNLFKSAYIYFFFFHVSNTSHLDRAKLYKHTKLLAGHSSGPVQPILCETLEDWGFPAIIHLYNKNTVIGFWSSVDPIQPWSCSWSITTLINSTENLTGVLEKDESFEAVDTGLATSILHGLPNWVNSNVSMSIPAPLTWDSPLKENTTYTMNWVGRIMLTHHRKCFQFSLQCVEIYNNKVSWSLSDPAVKGKCRYFESYYILSKSKSLVISRLWANNSVVDL